MQIEKKTVLLIEGRLYLSTDKANQLHADLQRCLPAAELSEGTMVEPAVRVHYRDTAGDEVVWELSGDEHAALVLALNEHSPSGSGTPELPTLDGWIEPAKRLVHPEPSSSPGGDILRVWIITTRGALIDVAVLVDAGPTASLDSDTAQRAGFGVILLADCWLRRDDVPYDVPVGYIGPAFELGKTAKCNIVRWSGAFADVLYPGITLTIHSDYLRMHCGGAEE